MGLLFVLFVFQAQAEEIKVIGLSKRGINVRGISNSNYIESLFSMKKAVDHQLVDGLKSVQANSRWKLSKFSVGLGASGEIGIGPFQIGASIKQRLFYSR